MNTVLVVDDEVSIRRLARVALEQAGLRVLEAGDGAAGLKAAQLERPDLILLDLSMPRMSGIEVCRKLRAAPSTADIPVLLITGLVDQDGLDSIADAGVAGIVAKPFTPAILVRTVTSLLQRTPTLAVR